MDAQSAKGFFMYDRNKSVRCGADLGDRRKDTFSLTVNLYLLAMASIAIKKELFSTSIFRNSLVAFLQ